MMKCLMIVIMACALVYHVDSAEAQGARLACKDSWGNVTIRIGRCSFGETIVAVLD